MTTRFSLLAVAVLFFFVAQELHADPQQQQAANDLQERELQEFGGHHGQNNPQHHGSAGAKQHGFLLLVRRQ